MRDFLVVPNFLLPGTGIKYGKELLKNYLAEVTETWRVRTCPRSGLVWHIRA